MMGLRSISRSVTRRLSLVSLNRHEDVSPEMLQCEGDNYSSSTRPSARTQSEENNTVGTGESQPAYKAKQQPQPTWEFTENWKPPQDSVDRQAAGPVSSVIRYPHRNVLRTSMRKHRVKVLSPDHIGKLETDQKTTESESNKSPISFQAQHPLTKCSVSFPEPLRATIMPMKKKTVASPYLNQRGDLTSFMSLQEKPVLPSNKPVQSNEWQQKTISLYQKMSLDALQAMKKAVAMKQPKPCTTESFVKVKPVEKPLEAKSNVINKKVEPKEKLKDKEPVASVESEPVNKMWSWFDRRKCKTIAIDQVQSLDYNRKLWNSMNAESRTPVTRPVFNMKKVPQKYRANKLVASELPKQQMEAANSINLSDQANELKPENRGNVDTQNESTSDSFSSNNTRVTPPIFSRKSDQLNSDGNRNEIDNGELMGYIFNNITVHPRDKQIFFNPLEYYTPRGKIYNRITRGEPLKGIEWDSSNTIWNIPKEVWTELRPATSEKPLTKLAAATKSNVGADKVEEPPPRIITKLAALTARKHLQRELRV